MVSSPGVLHVDLTVRRPISPLNFRPAAMLPAVRVKDDAAHLSARRRTLYETDLANDVDAKRAEHRIVEEIATPRGKLGAAGIVRRLRRARR
jgi:hypothetical protein